MRKTLKVIGICLTMVFLFTVVGFAANDDTSLQLKKKAINVTKSSGTIKFDGKATEKAWSKAKNYSSTIDHLIKTADKSVTTKWPKDAAKVTTLKYLHDTKGIMVFISVTDKTKSVGSVTETANDAVEYHIDAKNCDRVSYNGKCDGQYRLSRDNVITSWGYINRAGFKANSKSIAIKNGYAQEVKIRLDWHGVSKIKTNQKVGFDLQINDCINTVRTYQLVWNSLDNAWTNPSTMGTLIMK